MPNFDRFVEKCLQNFSKGTPNSAEGSAVLGEPSNPSRPGKLIVNFDSQPSFARSTTTNYNVVDTDYNRLVFCPLLKMQKVDFFQGKETSIPLILFYSGSREANLTWIFAYSNDVLYLNIHNSKALSDINKLLSYFENLVV